MLPAQARSTLASFGSLLMVCAFEQGKKEYQESITADKVIVTANNSSHEAVTYSHTSGRRSREKVLNFQTPQPALLVQHTGAVALSLTVDVSLLVKLYRPSGTPRY